MDGSTMSASHKTARAAPFLRGFTNSPWTSLSPRERRGARGGGSAAHRASGVCRGGKKFRAGLEAERAKHDAGLAQAQRKFDEECQRRDVALSSRDPRLAELETKVSADAQANEELKADLERSFGSSRPRPRRDSQHEGRCVLAAYRHGTSAPWPRAT